MVFLVGVVGLSMAGRIATSRLAFLTADVSVLSASDC
jgi:hypothetical protein